MLLCRVSVTNLKLLWDKRSKPAFSRILLALTGIVLVVSVDSAKSRRFWSFE